MNVLATNASNFNRFFQRLEEALESGRENAPAFIDHRQGTVKGFPLKFDNREAPGAEFLLDCGPGNDGDTRVDFNGAFDCLNIVKFHDGFGLDVGVPENLVHGTTRGDVGLEADEFVGSQIGYDDFLFLAERMAGGTDHNKTVLFKALGFDVLLVSGEGDESKITSAVLDFLINLIGAAVFDMDVDVGKFLEELFDVGRKLMKTDAVDRGDADIPRDDITHLVELVVHGLVLRNNFPARLVEEISLPGECEALGTSFDKRNVKFFFDGFNLLADGRLGYLVHLSRFAKALGFNQVPENLERFNLHNDIIRNAYRLSI